MQTQYESLELDHAVAVTPALADVDSSSLRRVAGSVAVADFSLASMMALAGAVASSQLTSGVWPDAQPEKNHRGLLCKRCIDVVAASLLFLILLPLLLLCALVVFLTSGGPVLFKHKRVGQSGKEFFVWKFRSMCRNPDQVLKAHLDRDPAARQEWARTQKLVHDPRITAVGRFIRRFSIDELPQLWNVLKGEMSLVGPRPIVHSEISKYGPMIHAYYAVRPGMTGLWQVSGRSDTTYAERVKLDGKYSREWSPALDVAIFVKTFRVVLLGEGAY